MGLSLGGIVKAVSKGVSAVVNLGKKAVNAVASTGQKVVNKITGKKKWQHKSYRYTTLADTGPIEIRFTAAATVHVDSIRADITLANSAGGSAVVAFVDAVSGRIVGNEITIPATAAGVTDLTGFAALLARGRDYILRFRYLPPDQTTLTAPQQEGGTTTYAIQLAVKGVDAGTHPAHWTIPLDTGGAILMAGREGFQASGVIWRTLDVGEVPTNDGVITWVDYVPPGCSVQVEAWWTNDPALAAGPQPTITWRYVPWIGWVPTYTAPQTVTPTGWTYHGIVANGDTLPPARFWRLKITLTSNAANDETPEISALSIAYLRDPVRLGTRANIMVVDGQPVAQAIPALATVSEAAASLEPQLKTQMVGGLTMEIAPEPEIPALIKPSLRGKRVQVRAGFLGLPATMPIFDGVVRDVAWRGNRFVLGLDDALAIADGDAPNKMWPAWDAATAYAAGDAVSYAGKGWLALQANTGVTPGTDPATWQEMASPWRPLAYDAAHHPQGVDWHLAEIAEDLLRNQLGVPSYRLDGAAFAALKQLYPNKTCTGRTIERPTKVRKLLDEIAWLLEGWWAERDGKITFVPEPDPATAQPVAEITPHDLAEGLQVRFGWRDAKNTCLILTGWTPTQGDQGYFAAGISSVDAAAIAQQGQVHAFTFRDYWGVQQGELQAIADRFVQRWAYGRMRVRATVSLRHAGIEPGDVVRLISDQLPPQRKQLLAVVLRRGLDWQRQALVLDLMEV